MLSDTTFLVYYHKDSDDRARNIYWMIDWFEAIGLNYSVRRGHLKAGWTHRTAARNALAGNATTKVVCQIDADVFCDTSQLIKAERMIIAGEADFVYPWTTFYRDGLPTDQNVGGCVFLHREKYLAIGGENENYVGWGPEDKDRHERMSRLGRLSRIPGNLYHLHHERGPQSSRNHPFWESNMAEIRKVRMMTDGELLAYAQRGFK